MSAAEGNDGGAASVTELRAPKGERAKAPKKPPERFTRLREPEGGPDSVRLIGAICGVCEAIEEMLVMAGCSDRDTHDRTVRMAGAASILLQQVLDRVDID